MKKDQQSSTPKEKHSSAKENKKNAQFNPGTKKSTDPQEDMEGPISSLVQRTKEKVEENDDESPEDAANK